MDSRQPGIAYFGEEEDGEIDLHRLCGHQRFCPVGLPRDIDAGSVGMRGFQNPFRSGALCI